MRFINLKSEQSLGLVFCALSFTLLLALFRYERGYESGTKKNCTYRNYFVLLHSKAIRKISK